MADEPPHRHRLDPEAEDPERPDAFFCATCGEWTLMPPLTEELWLYFVFLTVARWPTRAGDLRRRLGDSIDAAISNQGVRHASELRRLAEIEIDEERKRGPW
jgi:hypothetical protein